MKPGVRETAVLFGVLTAAGTAAPAGAQPSAAPPSITTRGVVQGDVVEGRINRASTRRHEPSPSTTGRSISCRPP